MKILVVLLWIISIGFSTPLWEMNTTAETLFNTSSIDSRRIAGTITDSDGQALTGVNVIVQGKNRGVATDINGRFEFTTDVVADDVLVISMIGYTTVRIRIRDVNDILDSLHITLTPTTLESEGLFVTASRISQLTGTVGVSFQSIDATEISSRNQSRLDETLRYVSGLNLAENQVSIRGSTGFAYGTGSRVLLLVDGSPIMGPDTNDIRFTAVPMSQVQRVEIIKGPGSALYGSGALGGVINLITKPIETTPTTSIRTFAGVYEPTTNVLWKRNWDGATDWRPFAGVELSQSVIIGSRMGVRFNMLYLGDQGYLENSRGYSVQGYLKLQYAIIPNLNLDVQTILRHHRNQLFLYWNGRTDPLRYGRIALGNFSANGKSYTTGQQLTFLPTLRHTISENFYYNLRGRLYALRSQPLFSDGTPQPKDKIIKGVRFGGELEFVWMPGANFNSVIFGASGDGIIADSDIYLGLDNQQLRNQPEYAVFVQTEINPIDGLLISPGLRFDAYQIDTGNTLTKLSPKINTSYQLSSTVSVRASYGHGFRVPAISERFVNSSDYLPLNPNLDLKPEESIGMELGFRVRSNTGSYQLTADLVGFQTEYKNLIEPRFSQRSSVFTFLNVSEARVRGLESTVELRHHSDKHALKLGYTLLDHEEIPGGQPLTYRSDHQFIVGLNSRIIGIFTGGIDYHYQSKPERTDNSFSFFVRDANEFKDRHLVDLRISAAFDSLLFPNRPNRSISATVQVKNLLNYEYIERPAYLGRPRTYEISISAGF